MRPRANTARFQLDLASPTLSQGLTWLLALQWFLVITPVTASILLVSASVMGVPAGLISGFVARGLGVCGLATLAQVWLGHRQPAYEGPATITLAAIAFALPSVPHGERIGAVGVALIASGAFLFLLSRMPATEALARILRSPLLNGCFLLFLAITVAATTARAAAGFPHLTGPGLIVLLSVVAATVAADVVGRGLLRSMAVLVGLLVGFAVAAAVGQLSIEPRQPVDLARPVLGTHLVFSASLIASTLAAALLIVGNSLFTEVTVADVCTEPLPSKGVRRGLAVTGVFHAVQGLLLGMATVPHGESAVLSARNPRLARPSVTIAAFALVAVPFIPGVKSVRTWFPPVLGDDVLIGVVATLGLLGLRTIRGSGALRRQSPTLIGLFGVATVLCVTLSVVPSGEFPAGLRYLAISPILASLALVAVGEGMLKWHHRAGTNGEKGSRAASEKDIDPL